MTRRELWSVPGPATHDYFRGVYAAVDEYPFDLRFAATIRDIPAETEDALIHLNWVWAHAFRTVAGARDFAGGSLRHLDSLVARGCRLIWSIHEPVSHDRLNLHEEVVLNAGLLERATRVHVLSESAAQRCQPLLELPADRTFVVEHPIPTLPGAEAFERGASMRRSLGVGDDLDLVVTGGLRRRYKEFESVARAVRRRNERSAHRPSILLSAGRSIDFPKDRTSARTRRLGAATVDRHLPDPIFAAVNAAGDALGLAYSSGQNSGVLAAAIGVGTPTFLSEQMALPEYSAFDAGLIFDPDAGHDAIDAALDRSLSSTAARDWQSESRRLASEHSPQRVSRRFFDELVVAADDAPPADAAAASAPKFSAEHDSAVRQQLFVCRAIAVERPYAIAMRRLADAANESGETSVEFDALVGWFESLDYTAESARGIERLLRLGVELDQTRSALSALHRAIDLDATVADLVCRLAPTLPDDVRIETGVADIETRIGETLTENPEAERLEHRLEQLIDEAGAHG